MNLNSQCIRDDFQSLNGYVALPMLYFPHMRAIPCDHPRLRESHINEANYEILVGALGRPCLRPRERSNTETRDRWCALRTWSQSLSGHPLRVHRLTSPLSMFYAALQAKRAKRKPIISNAHSYVGVGAPVQIWRKGRFPCEFAHLNWPTSNRLNRPTWTTLNDTIPSVRDAVAPGRPSRIVAL